ncbi:unnamed protein product [Acanthoscelides obtectus]|uniref:Uncharacterized protein n=1 Tax=Acanthoscelides obtectus TaxID=200917 RepID=A0A9P0JNS4_ACAOB|nr:unnamed protein product [Acanthoscelides obtectus]CAK1642908.1 hypothetical protein AOBTE_LOCUS13284 [Acanthoscelides obtectus]
MSLSKICNTSAVFQRAVSSSPPIASKPIKRVVLLISGFRQSVLSFVVVKRSTDLVDCRQTILWTEVIPWYRNTRCTY